MREQTVNSFDEFFAAHYPRVLRSVALATGDRGGAEDAVQEAFSRALVRWRHVRALDRPATWVFVVAAREYRRRHRRDTTAGRAGTEVVPDPAGGIVTSAWIEAALDCLAPRQRLAVVLRFEADLTIGDVAAAMGCSTGTVKSTLHSALGRLRVEMAGIAMEEAHDGH
jgi:RNA polymerase sigma factor (sigma-70 family)